MSKAPEMHQNIRNPYQIEDNKAPPSAVPQAPAPLGFVVLNLVRISYVFVHFRDLEHPTFSQFLTGFFLGLKRSQITQF